MTEQTIQIKTVSSKGLCELVKTGDVRVGDRFKVLKNFSDHSTQTEEIVYNVFNTNWSVDTLVYFHYGKKINSGQIPEYRYMGMDYAAPLSSHELGSKDYHKLLEGILN